MEAIGKYAIYTMKVPMFSDKEKLVKILEATEATKADLARILEVHYTTIMRWLKNGKPQLKQSRDLDQFFKDNIDMREIVLDLKKKVKNPLYILQTDQKIKNEFILKMTYHSNAIEGSRMSMKETKNAIEGERVKGKEMFEIFEVINHKNAMEYMLRTIKPQFKITKEYVLKLHEIIMYNFNDKLPGKYRTGHVNLTNSDVRMPSAQEVPVKMDKFLKNGNIYKDNLIERIARAHYEFEIIHPFFDGNGRVGRLLMATQLLANNFAPAVIRVEDRYKYYMGLEKYSFGNDKNIVQMVSESILEGYRLFLK